MILSLFGYGSASFERQDISCGSPRHIHTAENVEQVFEADVGITADNLINP